MSRHPNNWEWSRTCCCISQMLLVRPLYHTNENTKQKLLLLRYCSEFSGFLLLIQTRATARWHLDLLLLVEGQFVGLCLLRLSDGFSGFQREFRLWNSNYHALRTFDASAVSAKSCRAYVAHRRRHNQDAKYDNYLPCGLDPGEL